MKLIFIRHGDPDYINDSLTEKGVEEAKALSEHICSLGIDVVYQSPLGRSVKTAGPSLEKLGIPATTLDWLEEFPARFDPNISPSAREAYRPALKLSADGKLYEKRIVWDMLPSYYADHPELFDRYAWRESEIAECSDMLRVYDHVAQSFITLLAGYGYEKKGDVFKVTEGSSKTLAFFCHFGITSVFLSVLWNVSPFIPLQFLAMAPTSVTELASEEREKGTAIFRTLRIGDISHLSLSGLKPSFSARFCERFENEDERH